MNKINREEAVGEAHGKLILVGEHIVVYNKPAIAIPFPLKIRACIKTKPGEISLSSSIYTGDMNGLPSTLMGIAECINKSFERCNQPKEGVHIDVQSEIPEERGLGSSAASATAIVRGIFQYFQKVLSEEELFSLVELAETYAHGKPSGIDMVTVSREVPIFFQKTIGASSFFTSKAFHIVVADSGKDGETKKAVGHVKTIMMQRPHEIEHIINEIEEIVLKAKEALIEGDSKLLGSLLSRNHEKLKELEVSNSVLDHFVEVAIASGALGAKLTGGGMGGCIIALAKDMGSARTVSRELKSAGAKEVWYFSTDSDQLYKDAAL